MKILFLDSVHPHLKDALLALGMQCEHDYSSSKDEVIKKVDQYHGIIIRSRFKLDSNFLSHAHSLKFIARVGAGMENIEVAFAESLGIKCLHAPEGNRDAVGEHSIAMLLCLFNNICRADREVRGSIWRREENRGMELSGSTVGIIGYGNMGSAFAQRLVGFDVKVLAYDKFKSGFSDVYVKESSMEELFEKCDVLSLHVPLTEDTDQMVNDSFLKSFNKPIVIINTARGRVISTNDLVSNLKTGQVRGACLDVLEYEKSSFEKLDENKLPEAFKYLIKSDKVVLSPHIAGWTQESNYKMAEVLVRKIKNLLSAIEG
jgi:D-3-phosphoglycerate dehydrogenase / 2-oxoglutarate reductase